MRFIVTGILPIGALIGGSLGQAVGLYPALVVGALGGSLSFLWVLFSPVRRVKSIPTTAEVGDLRRATTRGGGWTEGKGEQSRPSRGRTRQSRAPRTPPWMSCGGRRTLRRLSQESLRASR